MKKAQETSPNQAITHPASPHRLCIAPMMDWSDRHCRYFWRQLTEKSFLYTEMVTTGAILFGDRDRFLTFNDVEHPIALQVGGSDPKALAQCATIAQDWGYDEINLNCGCPSDRVQNGMIGAILMSRPELVAECIDAMQKACDIPVTVKHRIGIDDMEDYTALRDFVSTVAETGCTTFIVHARKAWLKGLSPKENREIPPLRYDLVVKLKQEFPHLNIVINGGIHCLDQAQTLLEDLDGVMIGREAYQNPFFLAEVDNLLFGAPNPSVSRNEVLEKFIQYVELQTANGTRLHHMSRHILGLYLGQKGARAFRRHITVNASDRSAGASVLREAMDLVTP